jgi:hypothetical protein
VCLLNRFLWRRCTGVAQNRAHKRWSRCQDLRLAGQIKAELHALEPGFGVVERENGLGVFAPVRGTGRRELIWCHLNPSFEIAGILRADIFFYCESRLRCYGRA